MSGQDHWEDVYRKKGAADVSWYQPHLARSIELIDKCGLARDAGIIDVGGGASTLVDDLLERGYTNVSVLDLAESALAISKQRLGARAERVNWLCGDVTQVDLPQGKTSGLREAQEVLAGERGQVASANGKDPHDGTSRSPRTSASNSSNAASTCALGGCA